MTTTSVGARSVGPLERPRLHACEEGHFVALGHLPHSFSSHPDRGRGPLGLQGGHREVADLIRSSERLAVSGDHEGLHETARQVVDTLGRHIDEEAASFSNLEAGRYGRLRSGQQTLLESANRFAAHPEADVGADLLALLVRQADIEEAAIHSDQRSPEVARTHGENLDFTTDWAIAAPVLASR